jgi:two-component system NtrC family sensor kinase
MLLAPLVAGEELLGVIKLASAHPTSLAAYEADLLQRFLPQASLAIRNAEQTQSLKDSVLRAERKHAMADLARGVAHDVNNALGAVLPIVQQMRADLREGTVDPAAQGDDLARIEAAVATCRRIFAGMLAFAKGAAARGARRGDLRRAVECAADILRATATRKGVQFAVQLSERLPAALGAQHELEQLLLNLMSNACEAMPAGGTLRVVAAPLGDKSMLEVQVIDTGQGMSRAELLRIEEAFYTTKPQGSGLGLAICRSIIGDLGGRMVIDSEVGRGTQVTLHLPVAGGRVAEASA